MARLMFSQGYSIPYTSVLTAETTNPVYSSNAIEAYYSRIGRLIHFTIFVDCSKFTSFGSGRYHLTLPFEPIMDYMFRDGGLHEAGNHYAVGADAEESIDLKLKTIGANGQDTSFTSSSPHNLDSTNYWYVSGTYMAKIL